MGLLKVVAYKQTDFTYQMFDRYINWVDIGMNSTFHSSFASKTKYYSMKISGFLTCVDSDTYEIFLVSNKKAELYFEGVKVISKSLEETSKRFVKDLYNNRFYDFEIRIIVDEVFPESGRIPAYVKLRWSSQNMIEMDIKPRNFYTLSPFKDNGSQLLVVKAAEAYPMNSTVVDTTTGVLDTEYQEERRLTYNIISATSSISGYVALRDIYGNMRGPNGETANNVKARIHKNWVLQETKVLSQDPTTWRYEYTFSGLSADYYQVDILLDDVELDIKTFTEKLKYKVV